MGAIGVHGYQWGAMKGIPKGISSQRMWHLGVHDVGHRYGVCEMAVV